MIATLDARLRGATQLMNAGRDGEALAAFEAIVAQWPDAANAWYNVGYLRRRLSRYEEALAAYGEAIARGARDPEEIHLNRAAIFADHLRREDEAERELLEALARNAAYIPALLNLGNLHEDQGRREDAIARYEAALAIDPRCYAALARIAGARKATGLNDPMIARLRTAVSESARDAGDRAALGFALGKTLDEAGAYAEAFEAYRAANAASRAMRPNISAHYDRAAQERLVDALIAAYPAKQARPAPAASPKLVFICGMFRSGSTLTEQVLAAHPAVTAGGEIPYLPELARSLGLRAPNADESETFARRYLAQARAAFPNAALLTDKRPDNFIHVGLIKALFPDARIVHTRRHPLDNCLSVYFLHLDHAMGYALDVEDAAHFLIEERRLMAHWQALYGEDILDFDYDAFVASPRAETARLLAHCGLPWDEACLSFHTVRNAVKTASVWQVREPLYARSSGRWRNYANELARARAILEAAGAL